MKHGLVCYMHKEDNSSVTYGHWVLSFKVSDWREFLVEAQHCIELDKHWKKDSLIITSFTKL